MAKERDKMKSGEKYLYTPMDDDLGADSGVHLDRVDAIVQFDGGSVVSSKPEAKKQSTAAQKIAEVIRVNTVTGRPYAPGYDYRGVQL